MAKLKLPFELEKPDSNSFVTQADQIGHRGKSLSKAMDDIEASATRVNVVSRNGFKYLSITNASEGGSTPTPDNTIAVLGSAICGYAICGNN